MTFRDLQGHLPTVSFLKCNFTYSLIAAPPAVDKISTSSASRGPCAVAEFLISHKIS